MHKSSRYDINEIHKNYMSTSSGRTRISFDRPTVDYKKAFISIVKAVMISVLSVLVLAYFMSEVFQIGNETIIAFAIICVMDLFLYGRWIAIWFVLVYQSRASIDRRMRCCFEPSCSEYTILALEKYGLIFGVIKAIKRLKRCHPPGGIDYP